MRSPPVFFFNGNADQQREYKLFEHFAFCLRSRYNETLNTLCQWHQNAFRQYFFFFLRSFSLFMIILVLNSSRRSFAPNIAHTASTKNTKNKRIQTLKSICKLFCFCMCVMDHKKTTTEEHIFGMIRNGSDRVKEKKNRDSIVKGTRCELCSFGPLFQLHFLLLFLPVVLKMIPA